MEMEVTIKMKMFQKVLPEIFNDHIHQDDDDDGIVIVNGRY